MTKKFYFSRQIKKGNGSVKQKRSFPVTTGDDCIVSLRQLNCLRKAIFNVVPLVEGQGQDGKDVSGSRYIDPSRVENPSQIIWKDNQFIAVSYDKKYVRTHKISKNIKEHIFKVSDWVANHQSHVGKSGSVIIYSHKVCRKICSLMRQHTRKSNKPLIIDLTGVKGITNDDIYTLKEGSKILECNIVLVEPECIDTPDEALSRRTKEKDEAANERKKQKERKRREKQQQVQQAGCISINELASRYVDDSCDIGNDTIRSNKIEEVIEYIISTGNTFKLGVRKDKSRSLDKNDYLTREEADRVIQKLNERANAAQPIISTQPPSFNEKICDSK